VNSTGLGTFLLAETLNYGYASYIRFSMSTADSS